MYMDQEATHNVVYMIYEETYYKHLKESRF